MRLFEGQGSGVRRVRSPCGSWADASVGGTGMSEWTPEIVVIGAACLDVKGHVAGQLHPATSNPGRVRIAVGGRQPTVDDRITPSEEVLFATLEVSGDVLEVE